MNASGLKAFNQDLRKCEGTVAIIDSISIDNEYDYENEILPLTIMRMRFAQNKCSTRSGNSFHDEISSKTPKHSLLMKTMMMITAIRIRILI